MTAQDLYNERLNMIDTVAHHKMAKRVPVLPMMDTWALHYAKISVKKAFFEDNMLLYKAFEKVINDMPFDGMFGVSNNAPVKVNWILSEEEEANSLYVVNDDGLQIRGSKSMLMKDTEYDDLFKVGLEPFMTNVLLPRKFPIFTKKTKEQQVELLERVIEEFYAHFAYNGEVSKKIETELGMPLMPCYSNTIAPDVIMDYLRDFTGMSADVRRHPDKLMRMCDEIRANQLSRFDAMKLDPANKKWVFVPLHFGTYMRPKDFEKIYFPYLKGFVDDFVVERGFTGFLAMENDFTPYVDILQELPTGAPVIGFWEKGDFKKFKTLGDKMVFLGGIVSSVLKYGTKSEVEAHVKETFDTLAPGGNFMCGTCNSLSGFGDGTPENVRYAMELAREYGNY